MRRVSEATVESDNEELTGVVAGERSSGTDVVVSKLACSVILRCGVNSIRLCDVECTRNASDPVIRTESAISKGQDTCRDRRRRRDRQMSWPGASAPVGGTARDGLVMVRLPCAVVLLVALSNPFYPRNLVYHLLCMVSITNL
jgi:hypothetical protein